MVESTRVVARYPPMIPVRMAAAAVMIIAVSPGVPMMAFAAKKVGTDATPCRPVCSLFSSVMYSCHEEKPSGTDEMLISVMEI